MNFVAATMLRNRSIQSDGGEYGSVTLGDDVGTASATSKFLTHEYIVTRLFILKKTNPEWSSGTDGNFKDDF